MPLAERPSTVLHVRCPLGTSEAMFRNVLKLLEDLTPTVEAVPPGAALAEVSGSLRYHRRHPAELAGILRLRAAARYGLPLAVGIARNRSLAAMASAHTGPAAGIRYVGPSDEDVARFAHPLPIQALHGVGPAQGQKLAAFGITTVGILASVPESTAQRILGGRAGRQLHQRARGHDPRPVARTGLPLSLTRSVRFAYDVLDPGLLRAALVRLAVDVGETLRSRRQVARAVTLVVGFAGDGQVTRSRTLREPSAHTENLRAVLHDAFDSLALQRARVRSVAARAEDLCSADASAEQVTFDTARENRLLVEPVIDRLNQRYGRGTVAPAAAFVPLTG
ncbi:hypothetical protein GCM10020000_86240 [Streptomyces olivoverticillatus]